jgi:hypothetical protein
MEVVVALREGPGRQRDDPVTHLLRVFVHRRQAVHQVGPPALDAGGEQLTSMRRQVRDDGLVGAGSRHCPIQPHRKPSPAGPLSQV